TRLLGSRTIDRITQRQDRRVNASLYRSEVACGIDQSACARSGRTFLSRSRAQRATAAFSLTVRTLSCPTSFSQTRRSSRTSGREGGSIRPTLSLGLGGGSGNPWRLLP